MGASLIARDVLDQTIHIQDTVSSGGAAIEPSMKNQG